MSLMRPIACGRRQTGCHGVQSISGYLLVASARASLRVSPARAPSSRQRATIYAGVEFHNRWAKRGTIASAANSRRRSRSARFPGTAGPFGPFCGRRLPLSGGRASPVFAILNAANYEKRAIRWPGGSGRTGGAINVAWSNVARGPVAGPQMTWRVWGSGPGHEDTQVAWAASPRVNFGPIMNERCTGADADYSPSETKIRATHPCAAGNPDFIGVSLGMRLEHTRFVITLRCGSRHLFRHPLSCQVKAVRISVSRGAWMC
jgi:hypothetical protein